MIESAGPNLIRLPFTILIDKAEKAPWSFDGIRARSFIDKEQREYVPQTERRYLGIGMGDYAIDGYEDRIAIERKSMADWQGTLLGWERPIDTPEARAEWDTRNAVHRRKRFKNELRKLAAMESAAVIVEASLGDCLNNAPDWGKRTALENRKYLHATMQAWTQEYRVPWYFYPSREAAEVGAFRLLEKFWERTARERREGARREVTRSLFPAARKVKRWKLVG